MHVLHMHVLHMYVLHMYVLHMHVLHMHVLHMHVLHMHVLHMHVLHIHVYTQSNLCAYQMLSPPTPPRADSTFEEGIVDDSGAQEVGPGVLFCSGARWRGRFWFTLGSERDLLVLFLGIPTMFKH